MASIAKQIFYTIPVGKFKGVSYSIDSVEIVDGKIKVEYSTRDLNPKYADEFEMYIYELISIMMNE